MKIISEFHRITSFVNNIYKSIETNQEAVYLRVVPHIREVKGLSHFSGSKEAGA